MLISQFYSSNQKERRGSALGKLLALFYLAALVLYVAHSKGYLKQAFDNTTSSGKNVTNNMQQTSQPNPQSNSQLKSQLKSHLQTRQKSKSTAQPSLPPVPQTKSQAKSQQFPVVINQKNLVPNYEKMTREEALELVKDSPLAFLITGKANSTKSTEEVDRSRDPKLIQDLTSPIRHNITDSKGRHIFHELAILNRSDLIRQYIKDNDDLINQPDKEGVTPICLALEVGSTKAASAFLSVKGLDFKNKDKKGQTILHYAAKAGNLTVIRRCLSAGLGVNQKSDEGKTPAILAAENNRPAALRILLANAGNPYLSDNSGHDCYFYAHTFPEILDLLSGD